MIFISCDHLLYSTQMGLKQYRSSLFLKESRCLSGTCLHKVHKTFEQTYSRNLVNDKETFSICHLIDFFAVWIMRSTEGVSSDPFHQLKISLHYTDVESTAYNIAIFMFTESS